MGDVRLGGEHNTTQVDDKMGDVRLGGKHKTTQVVQLAGVEGIEVKLTDARCRWYGH